MWLLSQQPEHSIYFQMAGASLRPTVILCVICASSFSFLLGYDIGIMSGAKRLIKREFGLTEGELELLVGILNIVSGPGGLISGRLADSLGRRPSAALACTVTLVGALLMATANSFGLLLTGRVITGIGVGCCFHVAPLYLAEIAPKEVRGKLISFFDLFINVGILAGYLVGWALAPSVTADAAAAAASSSRAWRYMLGIGALPPALNLLGLLWLPESPRFLVAVGREREAAEVLGRIYAADEADTTLEVLRDERRGSKPLTFCAGLRRVFYPAKGAPRAMIVAGMGVAFWQQATGVEAAVYYTPETLESAGITDESMLLLATVGVGLVKVVFIIVAACLVERVGRVKLLVVSTAGIGLSQFLLGLSFHLGRNVGLALTGQCLFMAAFSIGAGPCSMMVASELFPLQVRLAFLLSRLAAPAWHAFLLSRLLLSRQLLTPAAPAWGRYVALPSASRRSSTAPHPALSRSPSSPSHARSRPLAPTISSSSSPAALATSSAHACPRPRASRSRRSRGRWLSDLRPSACCVCTRCSPQRLAARRVPAHARRLVKAMDRARPRAQPNSCEAVDVRKAGLPVPVPVPATTHASPDAASIRRAISVDYLTLYGRYG